MSKSKLLKGIDHRIEMLEKAKKVFDDKKELRFSSDDVDSRLDELNTLRTWINERWDEK